MRVCYGFKDYVVRVVYIFLGFGFFDDVYLIVGLYNIWKVIVIESYKNYGRDIIILVKWNEILFYLW